MTEFKQPDHDARARRYQELLQIILGEVRSVGLGMSEPLMMEAAVRMAAYRLRDEEDPSAESRLAFDWPRG